MTNRSFTPWLNSKQWERTTKEVDSAAILLFPTLQLFPDQRYPNVQCSQQEDIKITDPLRTRGWGFVGDIAQVFTAPCRPPILWAGGNQDNRHNVPPGWGGGGSPKTQLKSFPASAIYTSNALSRKT